MLRLLFKSILISTLALTGLSGCALSLDRQDDPETVATWESAKTYIVCDILKPDRKRKDILVDLKDIRTVMIVDSPAGLVKVRPVDDLKGYPQIFAGFDSETDELRDVYIETHSNFGPESTIERPKCE